MLNIDELEKRYLRYKLKSFLPYSIFFIIVFLSAFIVLETIYIKTDKTEKIKTPKKQEKIKEIPKQLDKKQNDKIIIEPSYEFIKNIASSTNKPKKIVKKTKNKEVKQKKKLIIKKQDDKDSIKIILKRFKNTKSPTLSLFLAKKYYDLKDYKNAYKYAFITNDLDNKIEESWIIFIKSMIKLDKKQKAIKTLKLYIQHSDSQKAKKLLNDIYTGKF